jgi:DNA-directed RNA polymerase subunit RPC12/RpoP
MKKSTRDAIWKYAYRFRARNNPNPISAPKIWQNINEEKYTAFRCIDCKKINIYPSNKADGHRCVDCKGHLVPIGNCADNIINITTK